MKKKTILIIGGILILMMVLLSVLSFPTKNSAFSIPNQIGTYSLFSKLDGNEAMQQISKLHGKDIKIQNAYILEYRNESQESAIVWISESPNANEAKKLFERMNRLMDRSNMYTNHHLVEIGGSSLDYVFGMDRDNYYYQKSSRLIWISVSLDKNQEFIKKWLKAFL
jgi:hypothetical protein